MSLVLQPTTQRGLLLAALSLSGCGLFGAHEPTLRLEPAGRYVVYDQRFASAHYLVHADGEYDLVLDSREWPRQAEKESLLLPSGTSAPRQLMHIRVAWRPSIGMTANNPAATNAIIDWYVVDDADPHSPRYLHYQGTGLVKIYPDDDSAEFDLQPTQLTLRHQRGDLSDPFGAGRLCGQFKAQRNSGHVKGVLADLQATLAAGQSSVSAGGKAADPAGAPPARHPVGP